MTCFVCLENCSNRICKTCSCTAHPKCWGEYLKNQRDVYPIIDIVGDLNIFVTETNCPVCKSISSEKALTRSEIFSSKLKYLQDIVYYYFYSVDLETLTDENLLSYHDFFKFLITEKKYVNCDKGMYELLRIELEFLYFYHDWKPANIYHYQLFGEQLPLSCLNSSKNLQPAYIRIYTSKYTHESTSEIVFD